MPHAKTEAQESNEGLVTSTWSTLRLRWTVRYSKDAKRLQQLIDAGANVNNQDFWDKNTPLHTATYYRKISFIKILIKNGADANATDRYGFTPLHRAAKDSDLQDDQAKQIVALFIQKKANINAQNGLQETPLHITARSPNRINLAKELLE